MSRQGLYGTFFNFYLCGIQLRLTGPSGPITTPMMKSEVQRCQG
jgi:phospholipid/cholesterol/gamma-HCH transport system substrate-binding protein